MAYDRSQIILTSSSSGTGTPHFVGDARLLSLSVVSSTGSASRFTISLSNDNGYQSAIVNWSVATVIVAAGIYTIDPGARWLQAEQPAFSLSTTSANTLILNRFYQE
jgi:hypothetical protein